MSELTRDASASPTSETEAGEAANRDELGSAARARADAGRYTPRCRRKKPTVRFHASAAAASL